MKKGAKAIFITIVLALLAAFITTIGAQEQVFPQATKGFLVAVSPDGSFALVVSSNTVHILGIENSILKPKGFVAVGKDPRGIAINSSGNLALITNRGEDSVTVLKVSDGNLRAIEKVIVEDAPISVAITPEGKLALVACSGANTVSVLKIEGDKVWKINPPTGIQVEKTPTSVAITPDGKFALVTNAAASTVSILRILGDQVENIGSVPVENFPVGPLGLAITPDGKLSLVANKVGLVSTFKLDDGTITQVDSIPVDKGAQDVAVAPEGKNALVVNVESETVSLLKVEGEKARNVGTTNVKGASGAAITPANIALVTNGFGFLVTFEITDNELKERQLLLLGEQ